MDVVDYNIGQLFYLQVKGLVNNGFYEWTFHSVFFCAFVVIDCVKEKPCTTHILGGTQARNIFKLCGTNCVDNNRRNAPLEV
jgi:hypothetical protein